MKDEKLLKPADIAKIFNQSLAWVSKNHKKLGGVKIGGRMFFPPKEVLYGRLFGEGERMEIRLHDERRKAHQSLFPDEERGNSSRAQKKTITDQADSNRHRLFDTGE